MSQINNPQQNSLQSSPNSKIDDQAIASSYIQRCSYDATNMRLTVYFKSGHDITHLFVFPTVWTAFQQAPSKGSFYARQIKGKYQSINVKKPLMPSDIKESKGPHA